MNTSEMPQEEVDRLLQHFGYNPMFGVRDNITEAFTYLCDIGDACGAKTHVVTACMVYVNTLISILAQNGLLDFEAIISENGEDNDAN
jgi:hypothetical protein